jgi:hypothetical protein
LATLMALLTRISSMKKWWTRVTSSIEVGMCVLIEVR